MPHEQLVSALYSALGEGRWSDATALLSPTFTMRESESFAFGGEFEGATALEAFVTTIFSALGEFEVEVDAITSSENHAVALVRLLLDNGKLELSIAEAFEFSGGKIESLTVYYLDPPRTEELFAGVHEAIQACYPDLKRISG